MAARIVVFGATGYTGRLVAERLVAQGARPVLAGRDEARLRDLADRLGALDVKRADVLRQNSVFDLLDEGDVLVSTVGPFVRWGEAPVRAAIAAGGRYLDSTGEPPFVRRVFEEFDGPARRAGAALLPAMGYDFVPGNVAGARALREAGDAAVQVDVGYFSFGGMTNSLSAGTKASLAGVAFAPGFAFRDGALRTERPAARVASFSVRGKPRGAISVGGTEHFTLPRLHPALREVNVYLGWFGPLARPVQLSSAMGSVFTRAPGAKTVMRVVAQRLAGVAGGTPEPGTTPGGLSYVVAIARGADGSPLAEIHLQGDDPYAFTAGFMAWAAREAAAGRVEGAGALGPVEAFGLQAAEEGCAQGGLTRVREPVES